MFGLYPVIIYGKLYVLTVTVYLLERYHQAAHLVGNRRNEYYHVEYFFRPFFKYTKKLLNVHEYFFVYKMDNASSFFLEQEISNLFLFTAFYVLIFFILGFLFFSNYFSIDKMDADYIKEVALNASLLVLCCIFFLWLSFDHTVPGFQFVGGFNWLNFLHIRAVFGLDGISLMFILLTAFLIPFCILIGWESIIYKIREYLILLFVIEFLLFFVFISLDFIFFYAAFESVLIPMFILIVVWGSRERKIHAAYQFFLYTLIGSVLMLLGIIYIYKSLGTTNIQAFLNSTFTKKEELLLWICFFIPFAVKMPMFPFHIWLPEAHVEAPTAGSVLLAGILLKLGTYGVLRVLLPSFSYANIYFTPLVFTLAILGVIYSSCTTIRQIDLKKIIAYSSVAHMNFLLLGLFSLNSVGISGSIFLMLSHGLVSSGLFLCVGILYDRYHTRLLKYYGGLIFYMPIFGTFFLILSLANIGFPGTSSFIGELLIMIGAFNFNIVATLLGGIGLITGACYAMWLYNRVVFGELQEKFITKFCDLNLREFFILFFLCFFVILIGIYPLPFLDSYNLYCVQNALY